MWSKFTDWLKEYEVAGWISLVTGLALVISMILAWITHVIVCIQTSSWVLLVVGAFIAPIGIIHGVGSWLGVF